VGVVPILSEANHLHPSPAQLMTIYVALVAETPCNNDTLTCTSSALHAPTTKGRESHRQTATRPRREVVINV
jgi:hypothetical protein